MLRCRNVRLWRSNLLARYQLLYGGDSTACSALIGADNTFQSRRIAHGNGELLERMMRVRSFPQCRGATSRRMLDAPLCARSLIASGRTQQFLACRWQLCGLAGGSFERLLCSRTYLTWHQRK